MEAKEKAKELVEKFYHLFKITLENSISKREAQQCALIAVEELINESSYDNIHIGRRGLDDNTYWRQVKSEIEKM